MIFVQVMIVLVIVALCFMDKPRQHDDKKVSIEEQNRIFENADILSRKVRYETKSMATRIHQIVDHCFDDFKIIDNLILEDENGIEHQIPILCATSKGVILFQTVDYPGKGLFGNVDDEYWQIAQSAEMAQNIPNAVTLSIQNALLIKRKTGIDVKPIAVISKYTPAAHTITSFAMGQRVILEESLTKELLEMASSGQQNYPPEFLTQVKEKLLEINISEDDEDDEDDDIPADPIEDDGIPIEGNEEDGIPAPA